LKNEFDFPSVVEDSQMSELFRPVSERKLKQKRRRCEIKDEEEYRPLFNSADGLELNRDLPIDLNCIHSLCKRTS